MKKLAISFKLLLLTLIIGCITSCSNRKDLQYIAETTSALNQQQLVSRFLQVPADANEDVKKIIANIAKTEKATPFLANYAAKFGVPEWKYMFGDKNKISKPSQSNSNYTTLGSSTSTNNSNRGFYFIPLTDSVTKRTKAFIYCEQYNDTLFTYRTYDVDAILAATPNSDTAKRNKDVALGFAAYFEKQITGSVQTEAFKNNKFSNTIIRQDSIGINKVSPNASFGYQTLSLPCVEKTYYIFDFGDEIWIVEIRMPCAQILPEVVVISHPGGGSTGGGGGGGGLGGGGYVNPPPPPSNPPAWADPGSGSGSGGYTGSDPSGSYPSNGYGYGPYLPPNYWDIWNPYDPNLFPRGGGIYPQQPVLYSPQLQTLITTLGLNQAQIDWLNNNPLYADDLYNWLQSEEDDDANNIAALVSIDLYMNGLEAGPYEQAYTDIVNSHLPLPSLAGMVGMNKYRSYLIANYITLKEEHPDWKTSRLMWEAQKEAIQLMLDFLGTIPVIGEIADVTNGVIYTISGDNVNAGLSFAAAIPVAGWWAFGAKMAKKVVTLSGGGKVVLKFYRAGNRVVFSNRSQLRKVLGLVKGDPRTAHHIICWEHNSHDVVQYAAMDGFHMNEALNGIPSMFNTTHSAYNTRVLNRLDAIKSQLQATGHWYPNNARIALEKLANDIRAIIITNPNTPLNDLIF